MSNPDPYFNRAEVSNSDLSALQEYWQPKEVTWDKEKAYRFGTLVDAVITEPERVDYIKLMVDDVQYTKDEFELATEMKRSYMKDPLCKKMLDDSDCQAVMAVMRDFQYGHIDYAMNVRCKWDLWMPQFGWGGDIKSTTATTQKQFVEACRYFDYDRQRAWYMNIAGSDRDVLIGISKVNKKVFKLPIVRGDEFHISGVQKYEELAFKYWYLFEDLG